MDDGERGDHVRDEFAIDTCAGCHRHETATNHFMHVTDRRAMDRVDRDTLGLTPPANAAEERAVVLSKFLQNEIAPNGPRYLDFVDLIAMKAQDVKEKKDRKAACR